MSGTRVTTTSMPLIAADQDAQHDHADDDDEPDLFRLALHRDAATTLVSAIIDPIERSIPPEMTTTA